MPDEAVVDSTLLLGVVAAVIRGLGLLMVSS